MTDHWSNNELQFARLISELEELDVFSGPTLSDLCKSMDLNPDDVMELIDRAQNHWDDVKKKIRTAKVLEMDYSEAEAAILGRYHDEAKQALTDGDFEAIKQKALDLMVSVEMAHRRAKNSNLTFKN